MIRVERLDVFPTVVLVVFVEGVDACLCAAGGSDDRRLLVGSDSRRPSLAGWVQVRSTEAVGEGRGVCPQSGYPQGLWLFSADADAPEFGQAQ
jgi:hypothetical protein